MYLLYYMAAGTEADWTPYYVPYQTAWALININIMAQYAYQLHIHKDSSKEERTYIKRRIALFAAQAGCILALIPFFQATRVPLVWVPLGLGVVGELLAAHTENISRISAEHLTERAMLYILLTFGETIISVAGYFESGFSPEQLYFSASAFLIVVGMLMGYGYIYERILDRERLRHGGLYLLMHLVLAFSINNVTIGLEFLRDPKSDGLLSTVFMAVSLLLYFGCLGVIARFSGRRKIEKGVPPLAVISGAAAAAAILFYEHRALTAALSIVYVFVTFSLVRAAGRPKTEADRA